MAFLEQYFIQGSWWGIWLIESQTLKMSKPDLSLYWLRCKSTFLSQLLLFVFLSPIYGMRKVGEHNNRTSLWRFSVLYKTQITKLQTHSESQVLPVTLGLWTETSPDYSMIPRLHWWDRSPLDPLSGTTIQTFNPWLYLGACQLQGSHYISTHISLTLVQD